MNLVELSGLYGSLIHITDKREYDTAVQAILANVPDMLRLLLVPEVVIAAQTNDLKIVYFGKFRNVSFVRNQIMINDAIRSIGRMSVKREVWYIQGEEYQTVSVEPYRPEAEYHQNLIQL